MTQKTNLFPKSATDARGLWQPLGEETFLPSEVAPEKAPHLLQCMNPGDPDSAWRRALTEVGIRWIPDQKPILRQGQAGWEVRSGWLIEALTGGMLGEAAPVPLVLKPFFRLFRLLRLPRMLLIHIRLEAFLLRELSAPDRKEGLSLDEARVRSLALGAASLALTQRLPRHEPAELARWLASPTAAPGLGGGIRKTLGRIRELEKRRWNLHWAWNELISPSQGRASAGSAAPVPYLPAQEWQGISIVPEKRRAEFKLLGPEDPAPGAPSGYARYFPDAHPDTVQRFGETELILFGNGSVLCHACTVAREQNQLCITQLGKTFLWAAQGSAGNSRVWADLDAGLVGLQN